MWINYVKVDMAQFKEHQWGSKEFMHYRVWVTVIDTYWGSEGTSNI
jgi:hypothetical protein